MAGKEAGGKEGCYSLYGYDTVPRYRWDTVQDVVLDAAGEEERQTCLHRTPPRSGEEGIAHAASSCGTRRPLPTFTAQA